MSESPATGIRKSIERVWRMVSRRLRGDLAILVLLIASSGLMEAATIGAVVPFIGLLAGSAAHGHGQWSDALFGVLGAKDSADQLVVATALLCIAAIGGAILKLSLVRRTQMLTASFGHGIAVELQRRMLAQPYAWHVRHNSSEQLAAIHKAEVLANGVLLPLVQAVAASILLIVIVIVLMSVAPMITLAAAVALGALYYVLGALSRRRFEAYSEDVNTGFSQRIRAVQEGLGGIRDVILDGTQSEVVERFSVADEKLARARANASVVSSLPRLVIDPAGVAVIAGLALYLSQQQGGLLAALPVLGALALGMQRLLPLSQQMYQGWSSVFANSALAEDVGEALALPLAELDRATSALPFARSIEFVGVSYNFHGRGEPAVHELTFAVERGAYVALVGPTGSGKTTTADLLMGLLIPTGGVILIDGVPLSNANRAAWRANIAHVPQSLFLADATIAQNIAMAAEIDMDRVRHAAAAAQIADFVATLPSDFETYVGERGAQLSGGQRQRLAIARAIYKRAPIVVLDEATSALDDATEQAVLTALDRLHDEGRTIFVIAHRSQAIQRCNYILELEGGRLVRK